MTEKSQNHKSLILHDLRYLSHKVRNLAISATYDLFKKFKVGRQGSLFLKYANSLILNAYRKLPIYGAFNSVDLSDLSHPLIPAGGGFRRTIFPPPTGTSRLRVCVGLVTQWAVRQPGQWVVIRRFDSCPAHYFGVGVDPGF